MQPCATAGGQFGAPSASFELRYTLKQTPIAGLKELMLLEVEVTASRSSYLAGSLKEVNSSAWSDLENRLA
jgi:hypothetical protein